MNTMILFILGLIIGFIAFQIIYRTKFKFADEKKHPSGAVSTVEDKLWHEQETEFIFKLNEQLSLTFERGKISRYIVEGVDKFLYAEKVILLLLEKETEHLKVEYARGWDLGQEESKKSFLKKKEGISGLVIQEQRPILVNDLDKEPYLKRINKEDYLRKSFISIPLIFRNEAMGVLHVCDKKPNKLFTDRDFALMVNVGRISAIAFQTVLSHEQIQSDYLNTIAALASAIDARDHYTKWHSENVTRYSLAIAKKMNLNHYKTEELRRAALLHDIGKIGIKDAILLKAGRLTQEEFEQIKLHPLKGAEIIKTLPFLKEESILVRQHHERYDGGGYPDGIEGLDIAVGARILVVSDSFDAMTSDRVYRKALPLNQAIKNLQENKGTQFDPEIVESFLTVLAEDPNIVKPSVI